MTEATLLLIAVALAAGVAWWRISILAVAVSAPLPAAGLVAFLLWRMRHVRGTDAALFCDATASELRAGSTVVGAVGAAAHAVGAERLAEVAADPAATRSDLSSAVAAQFPDIGRELAEVLSRPDGLGVAPASLFDEIAALALARVEVEAEVAAATAPARATAAVLLGAPLVAVSWALSGGQLESYLAHPAQRLAALAGLGMVLLGTFASVLLARRR